MLGTHLHGDRDGARYVRHPPHRNPRHACTNQKGEFVLLGTAAVIAPLNRETWIAAPETYIFMRQHGRYARFVREAQERSPIRTAIVYPRSPESLSAATEARNEGLIDPVLIGPTGKIRTAADPARLDLSGGSIEEVGHNHEAAARPSRWA